MSDINQIDDKRREDVDSTMHTFRAGTPRAAGKLLAGTSSGCDQDA
ncbi:MAG: hypothetical protein ACO1NU_07850 [Arcticibacter sp.]